jgi:long-subunit fatty acid transport protein
MPVVHGEYLSRGGFNSLTYTEYFETIGTGFNLKLGGIARVNDALRLGFYYHTPTIFNLTDAYYNEMSATFDLKPNSPDVKRYPSQGGVYNYRVITPSRLGLNAGAVIGKSAIIGLDYEFVNYGKAQISGETLDDFAGVNSVIARKYTVGHNIRLGGEYNFQPLMVRAGYNMQGSPFGHVLFGDFVRHTVSLGAGFRMKNNLYFDFAWMRSFSTEKYYLFTALDAMSRINYNSSQLSVTAGIKF